MKTASRLLALAAATGLALGSSLGAARAVPVVSTDGADFTDLATVIDFTSADPGDAGSEITTTGVGVTFSGGLFLLDLSFFDPSAPTTITAGNAPQSMPIAPNNPIGLAFDSAVTQLAFVFRGVGEDLAFEVSSGGGPATLLTFATTGGFVGIVDPAGFDTVLVSVPNDQNLFLLDALGFGGAAAAVAIPESATALLLGSGLLLALLVTGRSRARRVAPAA